MRAKLQWASVVAAAALTACGGNGGDDDDIGDLSFQANAAYLSLATTAGTWDVSGTGSDGHTYRYVLEQMPQAIETFPRNGFDGKTLERSLQESIDGGALSETDSGTYYFKPDNLVTMGAVSSVDGSCRVTTDGQTPPTTAKRITDSGGLYNYLVYENCDSDVTVAHGHANWSLEEIDDTSFYCQKDTFAAAGSVLIATTNECHEVDAAGTIGAKAVLSFVVPQAGAANFTLVAKNY